VLVLIVVSAVFADRRQGRCLHSRSDDGGGMRAHRTGWRRGIATDLIAAGQYYCDRIKAGDGLIQASKVTMDRFHLPPGSSGIMGVSHAAGEVYCQRSDDRRARLVSDRAARRSSVLGRLPVDGGQPDDARWMSTTQKWWLFGGLTVGAIVSITLAGFLMYQDVRPVRSGRRRLRRLGGARHRRPWMRSASPGRPPPAPDRELSRFPSGLSARS